MKRKCQVPGCSEEFYGVNWCRTHWRRWKKHGDPLINKSIKHGMTGTTLFNRWREIKRRTTKNKSTGYKNYGGRGIKMCNEWFNSFQKFYDYMGDPPTMKHTIDRIDNLKGYEPGNVRWATYYEQSINKRIFNKRNKYGLVGVYKTKDTFYSMIVQNKKKIYLGSFVSAQKANKAYLEARKKYHGI